MGVLEPPPPLPPGSSNKLTHSILLILSVTLFTHSQFTHTHTHTHTLSHTHTHICTVTHTHTHSHSHCHTYIHTLTHCHTYTHTHTRRTHYGFPTAGCCVCSQRQSRWKQFLLHSPFSNPSSEKFILLSVWIPKWHWKLVAGEICSPNSIVSDIVKPQLHKQALLNMMWMTFT